MQHFSPIKKRILQIIDLKGISKYKFYQETGITRGVLDKNTGISEDNIAKFIAYFRDVDITWLLTGDGEMLKTGNSPPAISAVPAPDPKDAYIIELQAEKIKYLEKEINAYKRKIEEFEKRELRSAELAMERHEKLADGGEKQPK